jgi:hypothetical protein
LLIEHISAVPIVDKDNRVIGVVSEGLLHRGETGTEQWRSWWLVMVASRNELATEYIKSQSDKVKDVMTRGVISVTEAAAVADMPFCWKPTVSSGYRSCAMANLWAL